MAENISRSIVRVQGLCKRVVSPEGELVLLDDLSFEIDAGEAVAIVGASGSGKSTLLGILAGLDVLSDGQVWLDGNDLFKLDEDGRAALRQSSVGFVFQSFQLLPNLTALENVMLPLELGGVENVESQASEMLARVGLAERLRHYPKQLSGGEQQRVAIARAFVVRPKILFADEPTGNLDSATGERVIELLFELNREQGATIVLVTHDEALARRCNRSFRLDVGRLVASERSVTV
ncbi:ABC-type antimicrobial peptide transport system, ATPase component [hydrothermal vent metagenome]|uniref:ABC-type antimicrobial peptide transport system, ATPase component n=1 Tax=hydrothermal vent metagenome TaxID=652676 RepID=A0A3B0Z789_9ZZZZ